MKLSDLLVKYMKQTNSITVNSLQDVHQLNLNKTFKFNLNKTFNC